MLIFIQGLFINFWVYRKKFIHRFLLLRVLLVVFTLKYSDMGLTGTLIAATAFIVTAIIVGQLMSDFRMIYRDEILNKLEMSACFTLNPD